MTPPGRLADDGIFLERQSGMVWLGNSAAGSGLSLSASCRYLAFVAGKRDRVEPLCNTRCSSANCRRARRRSALEAEVSDAVGVHVLPNLLERWVAAINSDSSACPRRRSRATPSAGN
jgi:hypothetical protein